MWCINIYIMHLHNGSILDAFIVANWQTRLRRLPRDMLPRASRPPAWDTRPWRALASFWLTLHVFQHFRNAYALLKKWFYIYRKSNLKLLKRLQNMSKWWSEHVQMMTNTCPNDFQHMAKGCWKHIQMMPIRGSKSMQNCNMSSKFGKQHRN